MNIREAKEEILRTVRAYRRKDDTGAFVIPFPQQRPILLMGPPGIGKTAIMQQIAEECGIGLVSYTITHHTRQSAIGLPMITRHVFDGKEMAVTEYTMSEIVASVYEMIEKTGVREGILFLDEINCVSETLAPTMLQFLQYKTFGTHRLPEGWLIVTAGNQPQYNRSARTFDVVTLDRVKKMEIRADFAAWKEYALRAGVHGAILTYLELKPRNFYSFRSGPEERSFVTARGWEDLSRMLFAYEEMREPVSEQMTGQYLQDEEIARDFAVFYELYGKYREIYRVQDILEGRAVPESARLKGLPFDEKLSLLRLIAEGLHRDFLARSEEEAVQEILHRQLLSLREQLSSREPEALVRELGEALRLEGKRRQEAGMEGQEALRRQRQAEQAWEELTARLASSSAGAEETFAAAKEWFAGREDVRAARNEETGARLSHAFAFLEQAFGADQEMVLFLTELNADWHCLRFIRACGNPAYEEASRLLLLQERQEELRREILAEGERL